MAVYSFSSSPKVESARTNYANWNTASKVNTNQETTNNGGLLGGLGYLGEKLAVGFMSSIEGGVDYVTSGLAKLFGNDEWAEDIIANDWFGDWYSHPEEWYNPSGFWKTAGDVAGGIGTSLPGIIAATAITVATAGAGAGSFAAVLPGLGAAFTSGLGAAGNAVKSAYKETGTLDAKTYGYGALSGITEGAMEGVTTALSLGGGAVVKSFAKALGKETAKTVAKQGVLKTLASSFAGEFFEEATSEILDPYWKRMTYDPNAANATPQEVLYSGFVGGLSGLVMGGTSTVFNAGTSFAKGTNIANRGGATEVLDTASDLSSWAVENNVDDEVFKTIEDTRNKLTQSLQQTGGQVATVTQKKLLGDLYRQNVATSANMFVAQRALNIVSNAPQVAQRLSEYGYTHKTTGQTYSITAEQITKGYDPQKPSSIYKALRENETLRSLAVADATGRLLLDSAQFTQATLAGKKLATQVDFNRFLETATSQEINAVSQALGIDSWESLDADSFAKKIEQFIENGGVQQNVSTRERTKILQSIPAESAKAVPKRINLKNGQSARYTDGNLDIGIFKDGDSYLIHDYKTGYTTTSLKASDVNKRLASYNTERTAIMEDVQKQVDEAARLQQEAVAADTYARENVEGYSELSEPNKGMIRKVLRDAKAKGISDADALLYARVSARSGVDVAFDSSLNADESALYDEKKNRFVVNPNSKRGAERILIHELDHAIRQYLGSDGKVHASFYAEALKRVDPKIQKKIIEAYADQDTDVSRTELYLDEISAYHAEDILGNKYVMEKLLEVEPSLKDKILNFFKNASNEQNEQLSGYAKKFYRTYKKMFDSFAERNAQANASEEGGLSRLGKAMPKPTVTVDEEEEKDNTRKSYSSIARTFLGDQYVTKEGKGAEDISVEEFKSIDYRETEGYRNYVQECLNNMRQSMKDFNETEARKEIENSIKGIVDVAVAMKEAGYDIYDDPAWRKDGKVRKDSKKRSLFASLEPNSDYFTSNDISTICDKRKNFADIYDDIVQEEERRGVPENKRFFRNVDNYFYIHKVLAEKGLTQPCYQCYVESMRKNLAPMAEAFRTLITEADENNTSNPQLYEQGGKKKGQLKSNNSETRKFVRNALDEYGVTAESITIEMLSTAEGLAQLKIQMPLVYEAFNSFYGRSKPKMPRGATPFRFGELTALLTKDDGTINQTLVKKIVSTGGFRLQSYSDFQIQNFVDVLQVIFEAGTLGLNGHAYTKVPAFLEATKNTNLKRNISIFMYSDEGVWKIDRNDSFPMTLDEIYKLVDQDKSGNTGIIAVTQNEKNAAWVMANDNIAYFIPFHKSGVKMGVVRETIVREGGREILGYADIKDHTRQQSEVYADTADGHKANTKVKKPIDIYSFWDFENTEGLSQKDLIKKNIQNYINECKKNGYKPKFREYVENNSSILKNILKYGKELGFLSQDATIDDVSFEYEGYRIPYGYYKCLVDFSTFTPDGKASAPERLSLKDYKFDEAVEFFKDSEKLRRNELLQQFANDGERQKYAKLAAEGMSNAELEKVIRQKRKEVVSEVLDKGNSKSVRKAIDIEKDRGYTYSKEEYEHFGWARANDILTKQESEHLRSRFAEIVATRGYKNKTKYGEYMIEIGDIAENKIVYMRGTIDDPYITRILEIDEYDGTKLAEKRKFVYAVERRGTRQATGGIFRRYDLSDFPYALFAERSTGQGSGYYNKLGTERGTSRGETQSTVKAKQYDPLPVVHTFKDVAGRTRRVRKVSSTQFMIEGDSRSKYAASIEAAVEAENRRVIARYAKKNNKLPSWVRDQLAKDPDFLKKKRRNGARFALDIDTDYMNAVESGDMETAQRMVDEAAKKAGYTVNGYHGTGADFTIFSEDKVGKRNVWGKGFYFGTSKGIADDYAYWRASKGGKYRIVSAFLKFDNPFIPSKSSLGSAEEILDRWFPDMWRTSRNLGIGYIEGKLDHSKLDLLQFIAEHNNMEVRDVLMQYGFDGVKDGGELVAFSSEQIKSADPVTYDDNGNVIPLSKRFDSRRSDIRYAIDIDEAIAGTRASISTSQESYKPPMRDKAFSWWTSMQIAVTNEQAGIEAVGKQLGIKDIAAKVQAVRAARTEANEMIGGGQYRIGVSATKDNMDTLYQGEGLISIMQPITKQGDDVAKDFFGYVFHKHNQSRMTLKKRSIEWHEKDVAALKDDIDKINALKAQIEALEKQIKELGRTKHDMEIKNGLRERVKRLKAEAKEVNARAKDLSKKVKEFVPLEDKPVLGWIKDEDGHIIPTTPDGDATPYTAEESEAIVARYEKDHPEFAEQAEKLWGFLKNLNQYRVDTGLLSADTFDLLAELYPNYVPTYRTDTKKGIAAIEGKYNMSVKRTVKTAKGSTKELIAPDKIIARQVMETIVAGRVNQLANELYDASVAKGDTTHIEVVSRKKVTAEEMAEYDPTEDRPKDNEITFFRDGEKITIRVSREIFAGFDAFSPKTDIGNPLNNSATWMNNSFKRLVTSLNPAFLIRNTIRDIQDAGINTRYGKTFLKNYARAQKEIATNGKYWQLYRAYGGFSSSVFDFEKGTDGSQNSWGLTKAEGNILKKGITTMENANSFVEQLPRLAEFISSIEAGNSVEQAILDSADVTTNFGRTGKVTKVLNRTVMPFLNPSIQGFSKMVRNVTSIRTFREAATLALKAALVGIAPMALNMMLNKDDEDYEKLRDTDKENNFLFKVGDTFIKIPRGRVASALAGLVNRGTAAVQGEDVDWKGYVENVMQQVSPVDSMSRTIFSPFVDVATNTTWYGSAIEGRQFENVSPKDRYDENTSVIAVAIAKAHDLVGLEASPKKIHYLLDQYSGVIGDFILPATTPKEESDFFTGNFTLDPVNSNKLSSKFYDVYDEVQYADTAGDDTAKYQLRYLNRVKNAVSKMYKEKSAIQTNTELSRAEKLEQTRVIQALINKAYETSIEDFELMTKAIEATSSIENEDIRFTESYRLVYGAKAALEQYNGDVYEKMTYLNKAGIDYDSLYNFYFSTRGITSDKDRNGNTISGSKRAKVVQQIKKLKISNNQKLMLIASMGYSIADNDVIGMSAEKAQKTLLRYILTLKGATKEEKSKIASICGFQVENGSILNTLNAKTA